MDTGHIGGTFGSGNSDPLVSISVRQRLTKQTVWGSLELPAARDAAEAYWRNFPNPSQSRLRQRTAAMCSTVLVVDDSRVMRRIIIRALEEIGLTQVVEANDGDEALVEFVKQPFMLVLTDWNMPRKNGLEVIQGIRATGSKVPIIMITTESEKARVFSAIEAGVTDYLVKPFDAATLRTKVEKHVGTLAT